MSELLLAGIVCGMLLGILAGTALLPRLGEQMKTEQESYSRYQDAVQMKAICNRKPPELVRKGADVWNPGETVLLHQVFEAMDEEGNQLDIQVLDIQDAFGNSRMEWYDKAGHKAVFLKRGTYVPFSSAPPTGAAMLCRPKFPKASRTQCRPKAALTIFYSSVSSRSPLTNALGKSQDNSIQSGTS